MSETGSVTPSSHGANYAPTMVLSKLESAATAAGVEFIDENGGGAGVRSRNSNKSKPKKKSSWSDPFLLGAE
jgi:hypothetical protein